MKNIQNHQQQIFQNFIKRIWKKISHPSSQRKIDHCFPYDLAGRQVSGPRLGETVGHSLRGSRWERVEAGLRNPPHHAQFFCTGPLVLNKNDDGAHSYIVLYLRGKNFHHFTTMILTKCFSYMPFILLIVSFYIHFIECFYVK